MPRWRQLAEEVVADIHSGRRPAGSKLPSVAEQDAAGISQTTTMRAYRELVAMGLAVAVHGKGTYVADPLPDLISAPNLQDHEARIRELEERVRALEGR